MTGVRIKRRCAVYTRKSSEEGLEQDFNSPDAQREACLAYIATQRSEGTELAREGKTRSAHARGNRFRRIADFPDHG